MSRNTLQYAMDAVSHHDHLDDASRITMGGLVGIMQFEDYAFYLNAMKQKH